MRTMFDGARCGGQVSITIQPASTPGGMQGVRVPRTGGDDRDFSMGISWDLSHQLDMIYVLFV